MGISNTQYRDIMFQYDQTRMNNQRILDKRYETLFAEIPELEHIQNANTGAQRIVSNRTGPKERS